MANLIDTASAWEPGIYQLETTDPVMGGVPNPATGAGPVNIPHQQLAQRTQWLRAQLEALQSGAGYRGATIISASQTLIAADMGRCLVFNGGTAITLTMPAISAVPEGAAIEIINTGTANVTITRAGSDQIDTGPSTAASLVVPPSHSAKLLRATGSSNWHPVSLPASALNTAFGASLGSNGWQRLPLGLILQWGTLTLTGGDAYTTVTLPIAYSTANFGVYGNAIENVGAVSSEAVEFGTRGLTSFQVIVLSGIASNNSRINWMSLGF